ncbi:MAG TPA: CHASE2 domain-containing protein [Bryobacteraceae bacterium]|jgi:hypothetical protein|nr:CHASE2 domain-containing protein [Bryobacteraceae bacterium]
MPHPKYSHAKVLILTFIAIAFPFFVNEFLGKATFLDSRYLSFWTPSFWYRHFGPDGPRKTRIDEFKIVIIDRDAEPQSTLGVNRCTHRAFMAKLLAKVAQADPRLIVVDKWYAAVASDVCPVGKDGKDGTAKLKDAIRDVSAKVPLVIAVEAFNRASIQQICSELHSEELQSDEMVLSKYQVLNQDIPADRVRLGLASISKDERKIPLSWMAFGDCKEVGHKAPKMWPTVAAAAAELLDPNIMQDNNLANLQRSVTYPYTKLLLEGTFASVSALSLVCNQKGVDVEWQNCGGQEGDSKALDSLRHKVVIIGEKWVDLHETDAGVLTGPHLQANYIAALLDESLLLPAPQFVNYAVSAVWFILIFLLFYWWKPAWPELSLVAGLLATFCMGWFVNSVITKQFGVFANVLPPTLLEIIGLYLARRIEMLLEHQKHPRGATGR